MRVAPPPADMDRWQRLLDAVLDGRLHERMTEIAVDGIALVESRSVEFLDHQVRVEECAAVDCSCPDNGVRKSCAHRMAVAVRLWQREMSGVGCPLDDCDPGAIPRRPLLRVLVERYLSPSAERVRARKLARFEAVRRRENETGPREYPRLFADPDKRTAATPAPRRVALL